MTYTDMTLDAWRNDLDLPDRKIVPNNYPVYGTLKINRPISDWSRPKDPLLGLLPRPPPYVKKHEPTVWGYAAYAKSFEKFDYAPPDACICENYKEHWDFATRCMLREYGFLNGTHVISITSTVKNVDSTPGYPKFKWWKTEEEYLSDRGYADYIRQYDEIKNGSRPDVLWYLFLKKELLKTDKIRIGDIRQIVCPDPIYARIGACYEQDQNNRMKSMTKWKHGQCGWSPFEGGFDDLMKRLEKPGNKYIELDWTRFDGTIPVEVIKHIKKIRFALLDKTYRTDVNKSVYEWYVHQLCDRYVLLPSGEVTRQNRGNPSGQISTTMDNNMINSFLQAFEFSYIFSDRSVEERMQLWMKTDTIVYGDDRLSSWPEIPDDYVDKVIHMYKQVFGMWVKPEKVRIHDSLHGVSFCGFSAVFDDGMYLPVPTDAWKFVTSMVDPVSKMPDFDALVGKVLSFQILTHNLPDDDPVKMWFEEAHASLNMHARGHDGESIPVLTREMRDFLWRGGPKRRDG